MRASVLPLVLGPVSNQRPQHLVSEPTAALSSMTSNGGFDSMTISDMLGRMIEMLEKMLGVSEERSHVGSKEGSTNPLALMATPSAATLAKVEQKEVTPVVTNMAVPPLPSPPDLAPLTMPFRPSSPTPPQRATLPLVAPLVRSPRRVAAVQRWYFLRGRPTPCPRRCGAQRLRGQRHRRVLPAIITLRGSTSVTAFPCLLPMSPASSSMPCHVKVFLSWAPYVGVSLICSQANRRRYRILLSIWGHQGLQPWPPPQLEDELPRRERCNVMEKGARGCSARMNSIMGTVALMNSTHWCCSALYFHIE